MLTTQKPLEMVRKQSVLKIVRENGVWEGYIAPNKVNSFHIRNGWALGHPVKIVHDKETNDKYNQYFVELTDVNGNEIHLISLEKYLSDYSYYNCIPELGKRVKFWQ